MQKQVSEFFTTRFSVLRHVRGAMADSQDKQQEQADAKGRGCIYPYEVGDQVFLNSKKPTYKRSGCRLQDEIASALHWAVYGHSEKRPCLYTQPPAQIAHTPSVIR